MKGWKIAFFTLLTFVVLLGAGVAYLTFVPASPPLETKAAVDRGDDYRFVVQASKEEVESIGNRAIQEALASQGTSIPLQLTVNDEVELATTLPFFSLDVDVTMAFEPEVLEDGNVLLHQSSVEVGRLPISPKAVLKVMNETGAAPKWMTIRPKEEEIALDLSEMPLKDGMSVRAVSLDLPNDDIRFELGMPIQ
ncbi:DUF2140 family protein [Planococcaceae bacterium Storch 2/2-2]|nr:DUF2140 family protein [Planococcaceae bacterium Storch 2/2-2]